MEYNCILFQATCFTRPINGTRGSEYTGDLPCSNFNCPGCNHDLVNGQQIIGFPFQLTDELGRGGFARVARGQFHQEEAAFKFIPVREDGFKYDRTDVGCHEYDQQEMIKKQNYS